MLAHALLIAGLMTSYSAQKPRPPMRVFQYDPAQVGALLHPEIKPVAEAAAPATAGAVAKPDSKPASYVSISGNFGGVFYVSGVGQGASQTQTNFVNVTTNRALTFSANSFKPLSLGNTSEGAMGSITYSMALFQGTSGHVGTMVAGPVSGTDASFNGQSISLLTNQISGPGNFVLMISRTLTVTGTATGASTLVGTGNIGVTIN